MQYGRSIIRLGLAGRNAVYMTAVASAAVLVVATFALVSPIPAYADHNSMYVICPDPIAEGNSGQMGVRRSGYKIKEATFFTDHRYQTAGPDDYVEYHGLKVESNSSGGDRTLRVPVITKEDTLPEHDETFFIGFWDGGMWHACIVTIADDDAPGITVVEITSSPANTMFYRAGESIDIAVNFDQKVEVEGTPMLSLFIGEGNESTWRGADYLSGSGTHSLVFRYRVQPEDLDTDGISVSAAGTAEDKSAAYGFVGNIYAAGTDVPIEYAHPGLRGSWKQSVDGRPYVQEARILSSPADGWDAYSANQVIEFSLRFDTDVVVEGEVLAQLYLGANGRNPEESTRWAGYLRGSGTDTLVFGYTVRPGDMDDQGIMVSMGTDRSGFGGDGTIKAKGTDVERHPYYLGLGHQPDHKVDTAPPTVSSVSITSRPDQGETYGAGEVISIEVVFSEKVTPYGDLQLELDVGGAARVARLRPVAERTFGDSLVFDYTVQKGDVDGDGIGISANSLGLNGGDIHDSAGNSAGLNHQAVLADPGHKVATSQQD